MSNVSIRWKVIGAFAIVLMAVVSLGIFSINRLSSVNGSAAEIRDNWLPATGWLGNLGVLTERDRGLQANHLFVKAPADKSAVEETLRVGGESYDKLFRQYAAAVTLPEERAMADAIIRERAEYLKLTSQFIALSRANKIDEASELFIGPMRPAVIRLRGAIEAALKFNVDHGKLEADSGAAAYSSARMMIVISLVLVSILCAAMGFGIVTGVSSPIAMMTDAMRRLAGGEKAVEIPGVGRKDEIGGMAGAVAVFKDNMIRAEQLAAEQAAERAVKERRAEMLSTLTETFDAKVTEMIQTLSAASVELEATADGLTKTADSTQRQASVVSCASEEASANVQSVASATEEMSSSTLEISRQVHEATSIANQAVTQARNTDVRVTELSMAANRIGEVTQLITSIAEQTNLLALNATIEAARAGESGRGFAVVAQEVKSLASQTAKATDEIGSQIREMQAATQDAVVAIKEIGETIGKISEISTVIAAAVEEQQAATQEISRNVQQAASGTSQVAASIGDVSQGASETGSASSQLLLSAQSLTLESNRLKVEVETFLDGVRAA